MIHGMKIGYNEATAMRKSSLENDLILAEKYGYDYIEIRLDMLDDYLKTKNIKELKDFFDGHTLKPYALNAIENINFLTEKSFASMSERIKRACGMAELIDNPYLIIVPSFSNDLIFKKNEAEIKEDTIESINRIADIAEEFNIKVAFEPVGFPKSTVKTMQKAWDIVKSIDRGTVGLVIDAFNVYIYDRLRDIDVLKAIDTDKIFVFHINDCEDGVDLKDIELNNRVWPGDGIIPLKQMLEILYKKNFKAITSIELFREEYWNMDPDMIFKISMEKIQQQLALYYK